ncbi:class I SAM-dependent methyltransferase [Kutzneria sp. CA-103260]|nr:class I SAM-dependent methyltransferase [Kutzneria sp. CA-103260]
MQDADWEIAATLDYVADTAHMSALPTEIRRLVTTQADLIRATARPRGNPALPAYSVTAARPYWTP